MSEHGKKNAMQNDVAALSDKQLEKVDGGLSFSKSCDTFACWQEAVIRDEETGKGYCRKCAMKMNLIPPDSDNHRQQQSDSVKTGDGNGNTFTFNLDIVNRD